MSHLNDMDRTMRRLVYMFLLLSSSALLSACNGDDDQEHPPEQPVTSPCQVHCAP